MLSKRAKIGIAVAAIAGAAAIVMLRVQGFPLTYPRDFQKIIASLASKGLVTFTISGVNATDPGYGNPNTPGTIAVTTIRGAASQIPGSVALPKSWGAGYYNSSGSFVPASNVITIDDRR